MSEETKATEAQVEEPKKKNIIQKMKEGMDDKEEQLNALSTMVRLGILVWSGGILTLAYIKLPPALGIPEQKLDPTFIASVFTGVLATFGVQATKGKGGSESNAGVSKGDLEALIKKASETAPHQTFSVESPSFKIVPSDDKYKMD
jgi:hypothetical protein